MRRDPKAAGAYALRAGLHVERGAYDRAAADCDRALALEPNLPSAWNNRGLARLRAGRAGESVADFSEALRHDRDFADAYNNRAVANQQLGRHGQALADWDQAIRLAPRSPRAYYNRGSLHLSRGDADKALADFSHLIAPRERAAAGTAGKPDTTLYQLYLKRAAAYALKQDTVRAVADCDAAIRIDPKAIAAHDLRRQLRDGKRGRRGRPRRAGGRLGRGLWAAVSVE